MVKFYYKNNNNAQKTEEKIVIVTNEPITYNNRIMKKLQIFYQKNCPHCAKAFKFIDELKEENDLYRLIKPQLIEETLQVDYAAMFDYFLVPTFYIDDKKVHEGAVSKEEVREILDTTLED